MKQSKVIKNKLIYLNDLYDVEYPTNFTPKPILNYIPLSDTIKKSRFSLWVDTKALDYFYVHIDIKSYRIFCFLNLLWILSFIIAFFFGGSLMHASFINVNYFTNAAFLTVTRRLGAFYVGQAITIVALATILLYSYFVSNFFNTSLILFKESDEYKRTCKKYEDPNVLVTVRPRIAKTLRNMHFITKIQLIEYYENRKLLRKNPQIDKVIEYSNEKANDAGAKIDLVSTNKETIEQSIVLDDDNVADKKN